MRAVIVAGGEAVRRDQLDAAWPGWDARVDLVVAADGGVEVAARLGLPVTILVGDGDSLSPAIEADLRRRGVEVRLASPAKDESDCELAVLAAVERGADELVIVGALGGERIDHALANVWLLAHPALAGRQAEILDPRGRIRLLRAPSPDGSPVSWPLPGPVGGLVSLLPLGTVEGITTRGLRYPLRGEALHLGPARGLSNVRQAPDAAISVERGLLLIVETPGTLTEENGMGALAVGDPAPDFALADEEGVVHRLAERRGSWTIVYFYPQDDTPGCTTEACQFRDLHGEFGREEAVVWGISPDGPESHARFRAKFGLPFVLLCDPDHAVAARYGAWGRKVLYGRETEGIIRSTFLVDPEGRIARAWPRVKADGHAAEVLEALRQARAARVAREPAG